MLHRSFGAGRCRYYIGVVFPVRFHRIRRLFPTTQLQLGPSHQIQPTRWLSASEIKRRGFFIGMLSKAEFKS